MRNFVRHLGCLSIFACISFSATAEADDRIAIIDAAVDTRKFHLELSKRGVEVIGRYLGRCAQWQGKRLIENGSPDEPGSEIKKLHDAGFAVLSIYQYKSNTENKFRGLKKNGDPLPGEDCQEAEGERGPEAEARLDAAAAVEQARSLGQPEGTAIYFGVDFRLKKGDFVTADNIAAYFKEVRRILTENGYLVGAYGSGLTLQVLRGKFEEMKQFDARNGEKPESSKDKATREKYEKRYNEKLIDYSWIMASRSFPGTGVFHNSGEWDLFQSRVDLEWFGVPQNSTKCKIGLVVDVNVQNPANPDRDTPHVGFWNLDGPYTVSQNRSEEIHDARRFACNGESIVRRTSQSSHKDRMNKTVCHRETPTTGVVKKLPSLISYANPVRIGDQVGSLVEVDVNDDGEMDGWTWVENLTPDFKTKPLWKDGGGHSGVKCPTP